jgi:Ser/Thr protein kinase RdoA (MazF antagonist)
MAVIGDEVAAAFGLGRATSTMVEAAQGWGGHNTVYRLETTTGRWALKATGRELDELYRGRLEIEMAAFQGGVRMPRPVPAIDGSPYAMIEGRRFRCHEWIDGVAKWNEDTTSHESRRMGRLVAHLHGLALPWPEALDERAPPKDHRSWTDLAEVAGRQGSSLTLRLAADVATLEDLAARARRSEKDHRRMARVGTHRDLNAHNVLFSDDGLYLIDWDAAGPLAPAWERANYATLWSARRGGRHDLEACVSWLQGYREVGGEVTEDDPDTLVLLLGNVEGWARLNVRWALDHQTAEQAHHAGMLIDALLKTPATIEDRRRLLQEAISRLAGPASPHS